MDHAPPVNERPFSLTNPRMIDGVYYIPSKALVPGLHKIVLKANELFAIFDDTGSCPRLFSQELGVFWRDTRYLDTWELIVNDEALSPLTHTLSPDSSSCSFTMTNRDMVSIDHGGRVGRDLLAVRRVLRLEDHGLVEEFEIKNYDTQPHTLKLVRRAASTFDDIFEVRGMKRTERGELLAPKTTPDRHAVVLGYRGLNHVMYTTHIWSSIPIQSVVIERHSVLVEHHLNLNSKSSCSYRSLVGFAQNTKVGSQLENLGELRAAAGAAAKGPGMGLKLPEITTSCPQLNKALATAGADILALLIGYGKDCYPAAGIPWYCAPFGRDGIITAYQMLPWCPEIAAGVIDYCFERLGTTVDEFTDAEPGKVFHEERFGEMAQTREIPFIPYYGSVDATPLVLILLAEYATWTGKLAAVRARWEQACTALEWIRRSLAKSAGGFLSYQASRATGLRNQGWKDSHDSIMHADGSIAEPPIALCEVQGYAYRALSVMAKLARRLHIGEAEAALWETEAAALRERFQAAFWDDERQMVAMALDGDGRPCRVMGSNQGQVLWSGIVNDSQAAKVAAALLNESSFSGHGIRTLSTDEVAYNPLSYHNGSVWPHDNSLIAEGLRYYDRREELIRLSTGLLRVAEYASDKRLPELFCGFARSGNSKPVPYDVACKPQAWAAGALFLVIKALLGIQMHPESGELVFKSPVLPAHLSFVEVRNLPVLAGSVDVVARRGTLLSTIEVLRKSDAQSRIIAIT